VTIAQVVYITPAGRRLLDDADSESERTSVGLEELRIGESQAHTASTGRSVGGDSELESQLRGI
jgi:hypothetical protein